jgi:hypothetical protein
MNTTDHWDDLTAAGQVPPSSAEVLAHARRQLDAKAISTSRWTTTRQWSLAVLGTASAVAALVGAVVVYQSSSGPVPVGGSTPSGQPSQPASGAIPSTPSDKPSQGMAGSCAFTYSLPELKKRGFAFDGTVLAAVEDQAQAIPTYLVTMRVEEWFRPGAGPEQVTVRMYRAPGEASYGTPSEFGPEYTIGSRLLTAGESLSGSGDPLKHPVAWGCGFSRTYDVRTAATWRQVLRK